MLIRTSTLASLGAGLVTVAAQNDTSTCHDYVVVSTRGTFEKQGPSIGFPRMIQWTLGNVTGGIERDTVYPAAENQTYYFGADDVVQYIDSSVQSCPSQRYVLLGYSQGASVTGAALHNYTDPNSAGYKAIQAVVVIGNPYKIPNKDSDVDQDGGKSNDNLRGSLYNASLPDEYGNGIPDIYYSDGKLLDICYDNDPICAPGSPNNSLTDHLLYGGSDSVQEMGAKFLIEKLSATNATSATNGSATSTSTGSGASAAAGTGTPTTSSGGTTSSSASTGAAVSLQIPTSAFALGLALVMGIMI